MSRILGNASFVFNPAGNVISYKEDKAYSVLPNDGTVDGVVSGNSGGGTRVNQQGYIESTPANLNTNSEKFGGGFWNNFGGTITDDSVIAPNGTLTGTTFNGSPAGTYKTFSGLVAGQIYTVSMYVKLGTATNCVIIINNSIAWNTVGGKSFTSNDGLNTTDWTRISYTFTCPSNGQINWHIGYQFESGITQQTNGTYFVWAAMLNMGSTALPYQPTTDRLNYPTIDYKNGKGKILIQPQRTNYITNNQTPSAWNVGTFSNSGTILDFPAVSVTANYSLGDAPHINAPSLPGNGYYTDSIFVDFASISGNEFFVSIFAFGSVNSYVGYTYNKYTKQVTFVDPAGSVSNHSSTIKYYGNDIYRITVTALFSNSPTYGRLYLGPNQVTLRVAGPQYEAGSFATSLIPTYGSSVTRAGTNVIFNSPGPTKAFATKPGVILYDFDFYNFADGGGYETFLYNGGTTGGDYFYFAKLGENGLIYWDGNNSGGYFYAGSFVPKQGKNRSAWYFTENSSHWYVNGNLMYNGASFDTTYFNNLQLNAVPGNNFAVNTFASISDISSVSQAQVQAWTNFNSGSGGTISYYGPYTIHTFTGSGTFTPSFSGEVEVLVVAGGGGGGVCYGGGGGAGGVLYASSYGVSQGTGITVTIGSGGTNQVNVVGNGGPGGNSSFGGLTAIGGGYGGGVCGNIGGNGGSGGGGSGTGGSSIAGGSGIPGQGNNGNSSIVDGGGGGGGAGTGNLSVNRQGGNGLPYSITGFSTYYGGGGSGGGGTLLAGGLGGGGKGGIALASGVADALPYTGGGGGGSIISGTGISGLGGSGIVIVRYLT